ncbi:MAG: cytochrome c biogenesis protein CcdA [Bacteroidales bacterium]|nr:cytochrome c biogenesis protein CcdA [Bacteroidales bacterium]
MVDVLLKWIEQSAGIPLLTAFLLGLVAAVNPCQLAIHVSALTYLCQRSDTPRRQWQKGLLYLCGRCAAFFLSGWGCVLAFSFLDSRHPTVHTYLSFFFTWVEMLLPYLLMAVGFFFLFRAFHHHKHDGSCHNSSYVIHRGRRFGPFWLGIILAFLFCPESAVIFFGMMVPLGVSQTVSWYVPLTYSLASLLPLLLLLLLMRTTAAAVSRYEKYIGRCQVWTNALLGLLFFLMAVGLWVWG